MRGDYGPGPVLLALFLMWIALAIGNGYVAKQLGRNVVLWVVLSMIPILNYFFFIYVAFQVVLGILRRLNALTEKLGATLPPT